MSDDSIEFYGELVISMEEDGSVRFDDQENDYECSFSPEEFDSLVDWVMERRLQRSN
jgi:hypothetical protein